MKNKFTKKHKNVLFIKSTQGMAQLSLAVVSNVFYRMNRLKSSAPCARMLSFFGGSYTTLNNQHIAGSTSCARALNRLCVGLWSLKNRASSTSCARALSLLGILVVTFFVPLAALFVAHDTPLTGSAQAAPSNTLNFQGRLLTSSGSLVPDGNYHIEFKLYNDATSAGTPDQGACTYNTGTPDPECLWVETRTTGDLVSVQDGYFSVYLGEVDALPSIDWSQALYLGMNIGGSGGAASWDGEMTPRFKLTAVPYAFSSQNVASGDTNAASTNSSNVSIQTGDALGVTSNSGSITIDTGTATGTTGSISLGATNASSLILGRAGAATTLYGSSGSTFVINGVTVDATEFNVLNNGIELADLTTQGTATDEYCLTSETGGGALLEWQACGGLFTDGGTFTYLTSTTDDLVIGGSSVATAGIILGDAGSAIFNEQGSAFSFRVESDNNQYMLFVDGANDRVGIGTSGPDAKLDVLATSGSQLRLTYTDGSVYTDFTTNSSGDLTVAPSGGDTTITGTLGVTTLGSADTNTFLCRNSTNQLATCSSTPLTNSLTDNVTDAFDLQEGTNNYININTTNSSENISFGNATTNPSYSFLGSGTTTFNGLIVATSNANAGVNNVAFRNTNSGSSATTGLKFGNDTSADVSYIFQNSNSNTNYGGVNSLNIMNSYNANLSLFTNTTERLQIQGDGDIAIDTDTLFVDATNNAVGIGTASVASGFTLQVTSGTTDTNIGFQADVTGRTNIYLDATASGSGGISYDNTTSTLELYANGGTLNLDYSGATIGAGQNLTVDTDTLFVDGTNDTVAIGSTTTTNSKLYVTGSNSAGSDNTLVGFSGSSTASVNQSTLWNLMTVTPGSASTSRYASNWNTVDLMNGNLNTNGGAVAVYAEANARSASAVSGYISAGEFITRNTAAGTLSFSSGINILGAVNSGGGAITENYGVYIANQTAGTDDYGIYIAGADTYALWVDAGATRLDGTLQVGTLGATDTSTFLCRNTASQLAGCDYTPLNPTLTDNIANALDIQEGTNNYININTTNSSENISFGNAVTNPSYSFLGSGALTVTGNLNIQGNTTIGNASGDTLTVNAATVAIPNNLNFDSNTLFIDATNNAIGIGTNTIASGFQLQIADTIGGNAAIALTPSAGGMSAIYFDETASGVGSIVYDNSTGIMELGANGGIAILDYAGLTIGADQNLTVDTDTLFVDGTNNAVAIGSTDTTKAKLYVTGSNSAGSENTLAYLAGTSTTAAVNQSTLWNAITVTPSSASTFMYAANWSTADLMNGNLNTGGALVGVFGEANARSSSAIAGYITGGQFIARNTAAGALSSAAGVVIQSAVNSGGGSITENFGIFVNSQTAGTTDYGVYIAGAETYSLYVANGESYFNGQVVLGEGANRILGVATRTTNAIGRDLLIGAGSAGAGGTAYAGGVLTLNGGSAAGTAGNANGGNIVLSGGAGVNAGTRGLVVITNPTYSTTTVQNFTGSGSITQANIDSSGAILISSNAAGYTATLSDPTITTAGRVVYVTNSGSFDMTLSVNGGGSGNTVTLKPSTTATMIWNGSDWTAAGASSSTDLQAAYNNTATSAGGAELVLNAPGGAADGLTIRNNATTPIVGGLLEVQTSIGSNLFTVNNNATEYADNGGAESSTFTMWTGAPAGGTITRYTTAGNNIATGAASVFVDTSSTANTGVRNTLSTTLTPNLKYRVSYAIRHTSATSSFTTLDTVFSRDGTNTSTTACATGSTATYGQWTRISCTFTAPSSGITSSNAIFIRHSDAVEHDFYIDNLSVNVSADVNHAVDGDVDAALGANWTAFGAGSAVSLENSNIYNTSGSVQVDTTNNTDRGVTNNLSITPSVSTQYLVSFYAKLGSGTFNDIRVRYSRDGGTDFESCVDYNTQALSTSTWTKITCLFTTDGTTATNPDLIIDQPTAPGATRTFYVDALSITLNTNNASNVQVGGGNKGGPATLFTLDRSSGAPIADNNDAYLGSMYYDTESGRIQCYEADGWGACGAAPDNVVNLNPEYAGAVLNGSGVGTMTADFCSNDASLSVNSSLCGTGEAKNFYRWTSPQATQQTYSIYVTYQLPETFNGFASDDTVQLIARTDSTTNAAVTYQMYRSISTTGSEDVIQCWDGVTSETAVVTSVNQWQSVGINGNEATGCSLNSAAAGDFIIFKINMKANSNANAYVSTLSFTTTGR